MNIKILGTAAAEGVPGIFCNCKNCRNARKLKGKNLRARTQTLINDDLLIDFNDDIYLSAQKYCIDLSKVKYFLITHSHSDHLSPMELWFIKDSKNRVENECVLLGSSEIKKKIDSILNSDSEILFKKYFKYKQLFPFYTYSLQNYNVIPLPANHIEGAYIYIIEENDKSLLYCLDTGTLFEDDFDFLKKYNKIFDIIIIDCTYGIVEADKYRGHLSFYDDVNVIERMKEIGCVNQKTRIVLTHFSHWHIPSHEYMQRLADDFGYIVAYDGMEIKV